MLRPYAGPPGELWLAPRRPGSRWPVHAAFLLPIVLSVAWLLLELCGCTGTGSSCTTDDGCPLGMECTSGRCEPPPPPPADEPATTFEEEQHAG